MRRALLIFCAISIVAGGASPDANAASDKDFDLACAVVSAAEIAASAAGSAERQASVQIQMFYLGRLSARDDQTNWIAVINGRLAEQRAKAKSPDQYGICAEFVTKRIE